MKTLRINSMILTGSISINPEDLAHIIFKISNEQQLNVVVGYSGREPIPNNPSPHHLLVRVRFAGEPVVLDDKIIFRQSSDISKTVSFLRIDPINAKEPERHYSLVSVDGIVIHDTKRNKGPAEILLSQLLIKGLSLLKLNPDSCFFDFTLKNPAVHLRQGFLYSLSLLKNIRVAI